MSITAQPARDIAAREEIRRHVEPAGAVRRLLAGARPEYVSILYTANPAAGRLASPAGAAFHGYTFYINTLGVSYAHSASLSHRPAPDSLPEMSR